MSFADEIKGLTGDAGARRLGEIVDALNDRLNQCCPEGSDLKPKRPAPAPTPPAAGEPNQPAPR